MTKPLTTTDLIAGADRDDYLGFGYLGGRRNALDSTDPEAPATPNRVAAVDAAVVEIANMKGWNADRLFRWANSKDGRWFADVMLDTSTDTLDGLPETLAKARGWGLI